MDGVEQFLAEVSDRARPIVAQALAPLTGFPLLLSRLATWRRQQNPSPAGDDGAWQSFVMFYHEHPIDESAIPNHPARRILRLLYGKRLVGPSRIPDSRLADCGPWYDFDPLTCPEYLPDEVTELSELLSSVLVPVAHTANHESIMIAEDERVFLPSYSVNGVLYAGATFGKALDALLFGGELQPVVFESGAPRKFVMDNFGHDRRQPYFVS